MTELPEVKVKVLDDWVKWLDDHHEQQGSIWLISWKRHTPHYVPFGEIVDVALAYGWIDSAVRHVDDDRYKHLLSPRKPGSAWSAINKAKVARMITEGRMQPAGLARIEAAKADGSWNFLDDVEAMIVPDDLGQALGDRPDALVHWTDFPPSAKRAMLEWIKLAKRTDTRTKRIAEIVHKAAQNLRAR